MSPTPPTVLLERSFLLALREASHADHGRATACYAGLVDDYGSHRIRLRARADLVDAREELFAPVERIHVAAQYRRAALRLVQQFSSEGMALALDEDTALTLVVMRRERILRIATFDPRFEAFELTIVPAA